MKKVLSLLLVFLAVTACQDITDLNDSPKQTTDAEGRSLFANATKNLSDVLATPSVNVNIFRLIVQHWTETTYTDESNYNLAVRNIPQNFWNILYRDILRDLKEARIKVTAIDPLYINEGDRANQLAMIEILETYTWFILLTTYGDIPYDEALDFNKLDPKYDDAAGIYNKLITRLDDALADLDPSYEGFDIYDLIYTGDVNAWIKFGNSIKLKMAMTISDVNPVVAQSIAEEASPLAFSSNQDNARFRYLVSPPNTNPIWVNLIQSGRKDFVGAKTIVNKLLALDDARVEAYFNTTSRYIYKGGVPGSRSSATTNSQPNSEVTRQAFEGLFMDYTEVEFYRAEMAERGWDPGDGEDAETHYNKAITASMRYWGVDDGNTLHVAHVLVPVDVAGNSLCGTGYTKDDILTIVEGTPTVAAKIRVRAVNPANGAITIAEVVEGGEYTSSISGVVTVTGGTGSGAYFTASSVGGIQTYLARPDVAYSTAEGGNGMRAIAMQKWIALYNRGTEAWLEWRRFDYPTLPAPTSALSATPVRYTYPVSEQNLNTSNYNSAATKIGGDEVDTKLWWDIN